MMKRCEYSLKLLVYLSDEAEDDLSQDKRNGISQNEDVEISILYRNYSIL